MRAPALLQGGAPRPAGAFCRLAARPPPAPAAPAARPLQRPSRPAATPEGGATAVVGDGSSAAPPAFDIASTPPSTPPTSAEWQLDFSSRPVLDDRGKKVWELLVCDPSGAWVHAQYLPSNRINSTQVRGREGEERRETSDGCARPRSRSLDPLILPPSPVLIHPHS